MGSMPPRPSRRRSTVLALVLACCWCPREDRAADASTAGARAAQLEPPSAPPRGPRPGSPERPPQPQAPARAPLDAAAAQALLQRIDRTLEARRWREALELIAEYTRDVRRDPIMFYNAACCHAQLGAREDAAKALLDAVRAGFLDFDTMEEDPDLEPIRDHPIYEAILDARERVERGGAFDAPTATSPGGTGDASPTSLVSPQQEEWRRLHGEKNYRYESDPARRLFYATCLDDEMQRELHALVDRQADWLAKHLFGGMPTYPTFIAVPTTQDAKKYLDDPKNTGVYEHRTRMLVVRDIGESLKHELVHLMHYGSMERLRQKHPMWVQEGLATLFESYEWVPGPDGDDLRFLPNVRHNIAKRAVESGASMPWSRLVRLSGEEFMERAQATYPQVRSIFEYLADRGMLVAFYKALVETHADDPSGAAALERIFRKPLGDIERQWRDWMNARPAIDDVVSEGDASLGIQIAEVPEGLRIRSTTPKSAARAAGLKAGDVVVAIDGRAVRSSRELSLAIAAKKVGDVVVVRWRRGDEYLDAPVTLRPLVQRRSLPVTGP